MKKVCLITGINGQDGSFLAKIAIENFKQKLRRAEQRLDEKEKALTKKKEEVENLKIALKKKEQAPPSPTHSNNIKKSNTKIRKRKRNGNKKKAGKSRIAQRQEEWLKNFNEQYS